jgi:Uncharacterized protein conserved in bacteria (DUF2332)
MSAEVPELAAHFENSTTVFGTSPLYRQLCTIVAAEPAILAMLTHRRVGQQASFLLFAALHHTLRDEPDHPLRDYYASLVPRPRDPADVRTSLLDFIHTHHDRLDELIRTRLVQSNVIRRAAALRYTLWAVARRTDQPIHLVEVGASAGLLLAADRYRYRIGDREFGRPESAVVIDSAWRDQHPYRTSTTSPRSQAASASTSTRSTPPTRTNAAGSPHWSGPKNAPPRNSWQPPSPKPPSSRRGSSPATRHSTAAGSDATCQTASHASYSTPRCGCTSPPNSALSSTPP